MTISKEDTYRDLFKNIADEMQELDPERVTETIALYDEELTEDLEDPVAPVDTSDPQWGYKKMLQGRRQAYEKLARGEDLGDPLYEE